jgi:IMP dehydrogenase
MCDNLGVDESPGDFFFQNGVRLKMYSANFAASRVNKVGASTVSSPMSSPVKGKRKKLTPERIMVSRIASGVSGTVVDKGPLNRYIPYLCQSIRHG